MSAIITNISRFSFYRKINFQKTFGNSNYKQDIICIIHSIACTHHLLYQTIPISCYFLFSLGLYYLLVPTIMKAKIYDLHAFVFKTNLEMFYVYLLFIFRCIKTIKTDNSFLHHHEISVPSP